MEKIFYTVLLTIFAIAIASSFVPSPVATFTSHIQDGAYVYGGSVLLNWDVAIKDNYIVLSELDIWFSNRNSGANVGLKSTPRVEILNYHVYLGTSPNLQLYTSTPSKSVLVERLAPYTTYYWQVVAFDRNGNRYPGPVWHFLSQ